MAKRNQIFNDRKTSPAPRPDMVGVRGGIAEISMISNASDLDALRGRLQSFAQHASTAFDTTLLGIGSAAVLSAAIFVLRKNEDTSRV